MANVAGKLTMKVLTVALGIPIGIVTKKVVARTWTTARPQSSPHPQNESEVGWADAIGYAALASAAAVAAKLITRKGAEQTYRTLTGLEPPPPAPTKAQKKLAKAEQQAAG